MPRRCEFGCTYKNGVTYHRFPHPEKNPEGFKAWVKLIGGKLETAADVAFYREKVICSSHFASHFRNRNNRLNALAIPTLHLHGVSGINAPVEPDPELNQPSTSRIMSTECPEAVDNILSSNALATLGCPSASRLSVTAMLPSLHLMAEHNYANVKGKQNQKQLKSIPSLVLNQIKTTRSQLQGLKKEIRRLQKQNLSFKARLSSIDKINQENCFQKLTKNMTAAAKIFTKMQHGQTTKKKGGRRFNLEEKVLSLSIYKRSPKCYTLLSKYFSLPSARCLKRVLAKVEIETGLNKSIFIKMKKTIQELCPEDRLCCLMFDEMSISPQIHYEAARDTLKGFAWHSKNIADHVLVYMVKGIKRNYKQPVAYYFTRCLSKITLKNITKNVVKYLNNAGLKIICTVCDQSAVNVSTINEIIDETRKQFIKEGKNWRHEIIQIGKARIIPLFDVPHLLKGIRNNLLTKNLIYFDFEENLEKTIKWEYFQKVYECDKIYGELKLLHKLTDEHIYVDKIKKMKVKCAAQIFSHSVAVATEHLSGRGDLPNECRQLIKFTLMIDNLFDSMNASTFKSYNGKIYKCGVKKNSPHHELWMKSVRVLKTVKFVQVKKEINDKIRLIESRAVPSIRNFIRTIEGMQHLWTILSQKYSFDCMLTRNFNQDPLENFFGNIRSYGVRNTSPNVLAFEGAFKSLLLNNFNSPHSLHANCENDNNECLQSLNFFLEEKNTSDVPNDEALQIQNEQNDEIVVPSIDLSPKNVDNGQANYVCGWVLAKCLQKISKNCKHCKNEISNNQSNSNDYIKAKEYKKGQNCLLHPSKEAENTFLQLQNITQEILKKYIPKNKLKEKIKYFTSIFVDYPFTCQKHKDELIKYFENTTINVLIYSWCRSVNRILAGKIHYNGEDDEIKNAAQLFYNKNKHKK